MMDKIDAKPMVWLLVKVKHRNGGGLRSVAVGGEFERYRNRQGQICQRRIRGTGRREFLPELLLRKAGFEVFLPVKHVWKCKSRFDKTRVREVRPLLLDWLFVGWDDSAGNADDMWQKLRDLDVVVGILGTESRPSIIKTSTMVRLMRQWGGGHLSPACHQMTKSPERFEVGDVIRVDRGPFQGVEAKVVGLKGQSLRVMLDLFGRETPAQINSLDAFRCERS